MLWAWRLSTGTNIITITIQSITPQIAKTIRSTWISLRSDMFAPDRCLMDSDSVVFAILHILWAYYNWDENITSAQPHLTTGCIPCNHGGDGSGALGKRQDHTFSQSPYIALTAFLYTRTVSGVCNNGGNSHQSRELIVTQNPVEPWYLPI